MLPMDVHLIIFSKCNAQKFSDNCGKFCGVVIHRDAGKVKRLVGDRRAQESELWTCRSPQIADRKLHTISCGRVRRCAFKTSLVSSSPPSQMLSSLHISLELQYKQYFLPPWALSWYGKERLIWNDRIYEHVKSHSVLKLQMDRKETETIFIHMWEAWDSSVLDNNVCDFCFI